MNALVLPSLWHHDRAGVQYEKPCLASYPGFRSLAIFRMIFQLLMPANISEDIFDEVA